MEFYIPGLVIAAMNSVRFKNTKQGDQNKGGYKKYVAMLQIFNKPIINYPNYHEKDIHPKNEGGHIYIAGERKTGFVFVNDIENYADKCSRNACKQTS